MTTSAIRSGATSRWAASRCCSRSTSMRSRAGMSDPGPIYGMDVELETDQEQELLTINLGPHHPATHGVLRLLCTLEGEYVREMQPIVGYVHTGIEKSCEDQAYWKVIPFVERMDYLAYYFNAM